MQRPTSRPEPVEHPWHPNLDSHRPAALFNAMVSPATPFALKGVIWYQGETNSGPERNRLYQRVFSTLITDWRSQWQQGNFPFLFVQISSWEAHSGGAWGTLRDQQRRTLDLTNTAMAVSLDVGDAENIHPSDKQTVAARLALAARALAYGESVEYSGPLFRQATVDGAGMRVWFSHTGGKLVSKSAHSRRIRSRGCRSPFRRCHCPHRGRDGFRQQSRGGAAPLCSLRLGRRSRRYTLQLCGPARIDLHLRVLKGAIKPANAAWVGPSINARSSGAYRGYDRSAGVSNIPGCLSDFPCRNFPLPLAYQSPQRRNSTAHTLERSRLGNVDPLGSPPGGCGFQVLYRKYLPTDIGPIAVAATFLLVYLIGARWIERRRPRASRSRALPELVAGLALGFALFSAVMAILWAMGVYHPTGWGTTKGIATALALAVMAGFLEELLFRGILFRLSSRIVGTWGALLFTSALLRPGAPRQQGRHTQQRRRHHAGSRRPAGRCLRRHRTPLVTHRPPYRLELHRRLHLRHADLRQHRRLRTAARLAYWLALL